jgi:hypothetical protein
VPPCFDVYVWVQNDDPADVLSRFIEGYVNAHDPGDPRFGAFVRTFVEAAPQPGDEAALAELCRDADAATGAFSLYLRAEPFYGAIITITEEGALVLGVSLDDPDNSPEIWVQGAELMASMQDEFGAVGGIAGVELAPPQSASEWADDALVQIRHGTGP